jgi:fumarate hydratase, class II
VGYGGARRYFEMNAYKPLMIINITHSITIVTDGSVNFADRGHSSESDEDQRTRRTLVDALSPVIGCDKALKIACYAMD